LSAYFSLKEKILYSTFWDYTEIIHKNIYSQRYENKLPDLREDPNWVKTMKQTHFSGENRCFFNITIPYPTVCCHFSNNTDSIKSKVVPHPHNSPHVAPSDSWLFAAINKHLKEIHFVCDEEVHSATEKLFRKQLEEFFSNGFEKLVPCWWHCIQWQMEKCDTETKYIF
jgi:hypothetical protein